MELVPEKPGGSFSSISVCASRARSANCASPVRDTRASARETAPLVSLPSAAKATPTARNIPSGAPEATFIVSVTAPALPNRSFANAAISVRATSLGTNPPSVTAPPSRRAVQM